MANAYEALVEHLRQGGLVGFLGAGVSRMYKDTETGRQWPGLPAAADVVAELSKKRSYIDPTLPFHEAFFLYKMHEGRGELEKELLEQIDRPSIKPLPAHVVLANLPFAAFYTTNYDRLVETALQDAKRRVHPIIEDDDVSRLRSDHMPVVKLHGCVTRPGTIVAAQDEYELLSDRAPIIEALLKTHFSNKAVLFLGYGLSDLDFEVEYFRIRRLLGDRMPRGYAVVHQAERYQKDYWRHQGLEIIEADLTEFLRGLLRATTEGARAVVYHPGEDWIDNAFFQSLHQIRTLPSETQVIQAYLLHLLEELRSPGFSFQDVLSRATKAAKLVLEQRPNYEALRRVSAEVLERMHQLDSKDEAEEYLRELLATRQAFEQGIQARSKSLVQRGDSILVYSQSVRVLQLLRGASRGVQDACQIFIAECRPKSPHSFTDALAVSEELVDTGYEVTIVPDAAMGNLIQRKQVQKIFMGAHAVFTDGGKPVSFINTCGSVLLLDTAERASIPVFVVAESTKLRELPAEPVETFMSFQEEERLFEGVAKEISDLKARGGRVRGLNIGYDYCTFHPNVVLVTEQSS